jgi:hypothetical protein
MVVEYFAMARAPTLGEHVHEARWKVQAGLEGSLLDIRVQVDMANSDRPGVRVTSGKEVLYAVQPGDYANDDMLEDIVFQWPFRREVQDIKKDGVYEVSLFGGKGGRQWFPAKIMSQRPDGLLEVVARMPNSTGDEQEVNLPAVRADDLREMEKQRPLSLELDCLVLEVPRAHPRGAKLRVDGAGPATHQLAWKSLPPAVAFQVSKDRKHVTANVGHSELSHYVSGQVRGGGGHAHARNERSWTIHVGTTQHIITLTRKSLNSKILALSIDGSPFVEASALDLDCIDGAWNCNFKLRGERVLNFEVFETSRQGQPLDSKNHVLEKTKYEHLCAVRLACNRDLCAAELTVNGVPHRRLPPVRRQHAEKNLDMQHEALQIQYGITAPHYINQDLPSLLQVGLESVTRALQDAPTKIQTSYESAAAAFADLDAASKIQAGYESVAAAFTEAPAKLQAGYDTAATNFTTGQEKDSQGNTLTAV